MLSKSYFWALKQTQWFIWFSKQAMVASDNLWKVPTLFIFKPYHFSRHHMFFREKGALSLSQNRCVFGKCNLKGVYFSINFEDERPATLLKMNPDTFTFNGISYRYKTCSWDSKTFRSIHLPMIEKYCCSSPWVNITIVFIEHLEEDDKYILNFTGPIPKVCLKY